jgi:Predicted nucleotide-binding protein containing TIR-like domain
MVTNVNTFASHLRHFAKSVDIVDDAIFDRIRELIYKYVKNELDAVYFELMREQQLENEPGLRMFWSSEDRQHFWRIKGEDGAYKMALTQAYDLDRPLWLVGTDESPLTDALGYEDQWSHLDDLPRYQPVVQQPIRTCVVVPLRRRRVHGIFYFESSTYYPITDVAKAELQMLGEALGILMELYETNRSQSTMTSDAIFELQERLESASFPQITKPNIFVASSVRADSTVVRVIYDVLDRFAGRITFTNWNQMSEAGNISAQITKEITRSRFGICYLSEKATETGSREHQFNDNANVVFEAGMLHALTNANGAQDGSEPTGWIPIREADSPAAPFDFAAERTIQVPRRQSGELNHSLFEELLLQRVNSLLGSA